MVFASMEENLLHLYEHAHQVELDALENVGHTLPDGLLIMKICCGKLSFDTLGYKNVILWTYEHECEHVNMMECFIAYLMTCMEYVKNIFYHIGQNLYWCGQITNVAKYFVMYKWMNDKWMDFWDEKNPLKCYLLDKFGQHGYTNKVFVANNKFVYYHIL